MQRLIKFRTWKGSTKRMYFFGGFGVGTNSPKTELRASLYDPSKPMDDYNQVYDSDADDDYDEVPVLMQYTGLKDKNGVEIYEGDIVECWEEDGGAYSNEGRWSVGYDDKSASFRTYRPKYKDTAYYPLNHYWKVEVIGNIYENSELLESK